MVIPALCLSEISRACARTRGIDLNWVGAGEFDCPSDRNMEPYTMDRKTLLIAQLIITILMAVSMSGIMSLIAVGPGAEWLAGWPRQALIAWPFAFVLTQIITPLAFALAARATRPAR
ncbi:DUF2798 domain-containing protein [Primorskyibacter sp. 2E107]|uniref:DUF2798 domain-containing protein n=1 Tax=Primorskyibacter sp. 2E107 TaxID=3403458 RepID=UPI003AF82795